MYVCVFVCVVHPQACPPSNGHIRAAQCSSYNQKPFMGRLYEWEPFSDGRLCVCPNTNPSAQSHKPRLTTYLLSVHPLLSPSITNMSMSVLWCKHSIPPVYTHTHPDRWSIQITIKTPGLWCLMGTAALYRCTFSQMERLNKQLNRKRIWHPCCLHMN